MLARAALLALAVQMHCQRAAALPWQRLSGLKVYLALAPVCMKVCPGRFFQRFQ